MSVTRTEFEFELPIGYIDNEGNLHKKGLMRLATASDEILPMKDHRVQQNPPYLIIILLARVIVRLGNLQNISTGIIEGLFKKDYDFLQKMYNRINEDASNVIKTSCPKCSHKFEAELKEVGE